LRYLAETLNLIADGPLVAVQVPGADQSPFRANRCGDVDPALALAAHQRPEMHLAVDVLP